MHDGSGNLVPNFGPSQIYAGDGGPGVIASWARRLIDGAWSMGNQQVSFIFPVSVNLSLSFCVSGCVGQFSASA